jgi:phosphatidylethanolamine N-methyltransferase
LTRSSDLLTIAVILYSIVFAWYAPAWAVVGQAVMWRLIHTYGLGIVLWRQSNEKWWVRRRIEQGGSVREAFASWKR